MGHVTFILMHDLSPGRITELLKAVGVVKWVTDSAGNDTVAMPMSQGAAAALTAFVAGAVGGEKRYASMSQHELFVEVLGEQEEARLRPNLDELIRAVLLKALRK